MQPSHVIPYFEGVCPCACAHACMQGCVAGSRAASQLGGPPSSCGSDAFEIKKL